MKPDPTTIETVLGLRRALVSYRDIARSKRLSLTCVFRIVQDGIPRDEQDRISGRIKSDGQRRKSHTVYSDGHDPIEINATMKRELSRAWV